MSELLDKIGFKKKTHIGISISSNNFIELVYVNNRSKLIEKYVSGNVKYNNAIREIIDYDELKEVIEGLFDEAGLDPAQCSVTLNLPNVHFGITVIDNDSETPYIIENLQSEIEDLYIFKRNEPIISYSKIASKSAGQKKVAYGAVQSKAVAKFIEIFDNMGCEIERIDTSYSSLLRTIQYCDRFSKYVEKEERTSILLVTPNSCLTFYLEGNALVDYFEEPLAVKSFSPEEVNSAISKIASGSISQHNPRSLLIISETDEVDAENLSEILDFSGDIDFINKSINSDEKFIEISTMAGGDVDTNMISYLTLEAVGAAVADYDEYPLNINFLPPERVKSASVEIFGYEVELVRFIIVLLSVAVILGLVLGLIINLVMNSLADNLSENSERIKQKKLKYEERIKRNEKSHNNSVFPALKEIVDNNTSIVNVYNALATDTPDSIYIKRFKSNEAGGIGIIGEAKTSESVNEFVRGLREKNGNLTLSKLSINTEYDKTINRIPNGYTFEVKTENHDIYMEDGDIPTTNTPTPTNTNRPMAAPAVAPVSSGNTITPPPPVI